MPLSPIDPEQIDPAEAAAIAQFESNCSIARKFVAAYGVLLSLAIIGIAVHVATGAKTLTLAQGGGWVVAGLVLSIRDMVKGHSHIISYRGTECWDVARNYVGLGLAYPVITYAMFHFL